MKFALFGNTFQAKNPYTYKHFSKYCNNMEQKFAFAESFTTF